MQEPSVVAASYGGEPALILRAGLYEAIVLPGIGGHVVALRDLGRGLRLLREPLEEAAGELSHYRQDPIPYGIPLLFPPNRIADGTFTAHGETYHFPINEPALHNHLHGFFAKTPWEVVSQGGQRSAACVSLRHSLRAGDEEYRIFPHELTLELDYALYARGLRWTVRVTNDGDRPVPFLLGFHTALRIPFSADSTASDCTIYVNIGAKWELTERKVPSGRKVPRDAMEDAIAAGCGDPFAHPIDALFSSAPFGDLNVCRVQDRRLGLDLVYETDRQFHAWMLWNRDAQSGFFCPEPMTCLANAPNLDLPWEVSGMRMLAPGETFAAASRLAVESSPDLAFLERPHGWAGECGHLGL